MKRTFTLTLLLFSLAALADENTHQPGAPIHFDGPSALADCQNAAEVLKNLSDGQVLNLIANCERAGRRGASLRARLRGWLPGLPQAPQARQLRTEIQIWHYASSPAIRHATYATSAQCQKAADLLVRISTPELPIQAVCRDAELEASFYF